MKEIIINNKFDDYLIEQYKKGQIIALFFSRNLILEKRFEELFLDAICIDFSYWYRSIYEWTYRKIFRGLVDDNYLDYYDFSKIKADSLETFICNCFCFLNPMEIEHVFKKMDEDNLLAAFSSNAKETIINSFYDNYDKGNAIEEGITTYYDDEGTPYKEFDEEVAKEYAVNHIFDDIQDTYGNLFDEYGFDLDINDVDDFISSSDFADEYNDSLLNYDSDDDETYYDSTSAGCYDCFKKLFS